ncbi:Concanavalin A-like lectin/glucanase [Akanthomyces lecanii RCEF 1005]|uniref:Concanavalin A-like lectin/glucanase n=1 Tax=Akanthomyces lecanii RCEF 1005 TaxID=1081108 RepID=A0A168JHI2_CORDF|nr:Concanavalin A-like lectin/glucanase [Akanthomyces lecanii RCEF 1005]
MQNNALSYGFWYEFYPKDSWLLDEPHVSPGDSVFVQVKAHNTTSGYAYMKNLSTGKDITINLEAPAGFSLCGSTAEWIQENATGGNSGDAGLAPFNTFSFDYCHALDVSGNNYNLQGSEKWFMQPNGNTICYPSNVLGGSVRINYNGPRA